VTSYDRSKGCRQCEGEKEIVAGHKLLNLLLEPLRGLFLLARWAMAIPTRTLKLVYRAASVTVIYRSTECAATAFLNGPDHLLMSPGHAVPVKRQIFCTVLPEYFLDRTHESTPCIIRATR